MKHLLNLLTIFCIFDYLKNGEAKSVKSTHLIKMKAAIKTMASAPEIRSSKIVTTVYLVNFFCAKYIL